MPRALANLGLDEETLQAINPNLIVASAAYPGKSGPWKDRRGFVGWSKSLLVPNSGRMTGIDLFHEFISLQVVSCEVCSPRTASLWPVDEGESIRSWFSIVDRDDSPENLSRLV